jgi:hypothetical protein
MINENSEEMKIEQGNLEVFSPVKKNSSIIPKAPKK